MKHLWAAILLLVVVHMNAVGQEYAGLDTCLGIINDMDRLACFDRVTRPSLQANRSAVTGDELGPDQPASLAHSRTSERIASSPVDARQPGAEQLPGQKVSTPRNTSMVTRVVEGNLGHLYFHMLGGSVWRQNEARHVAYPKDRPFSVEIAKGLLGDYQLRIDGKGKRIRVRRVE